MSVSSYFRPQKDSSGPLVFSQTGSIAPKIAIHIHSLVRGLILNPAYPCVFARSAVNKDAYRFALYESMTDNNSLSSFAQDFAEFVADQDSKAELSQEFSTFLVSFLTPRSTNEVQFEGYLWEVLNGLHALDTVAWDATTTSDPDSPLFSFSFAGRSYFVIGLHGGASRFSRIFPYPTLVFNAHRQFQTLKDEGKFESSQTTIRKRDTLIQGSINRSLTDYGNDSEAKQYSGRHVEPEWKCPFKPKKKGA